MSAWIDRDETLRLLGVKPQTLYAYVSRKLLTALPDPADPRRSLYSRSEVEGLVKHRRRGRGAAEVAEGAISWGDAILPTSISSVAGGRLYYRGRDAVVLARTATLEAAAALLWDVAELPEVGQPLGFDGDLPPIEAAMSMLAAAACRSDPTRGRAAVSLLEESAKLLRSVAAALGAELSAGADIAAGFARRWNRDPAAERAMRMALVLMADHELNASAFAARVAASTGAPLAAAALSGFAALLGPSHGGATRRVRALVDEAAFKGPRRAVRERLARGDALPGFGHPLYPDIDPRAAALLAQLPLPDLLEELSSEAVDATGIRPDIDFATVAVACTYDLPRDAPIQMFAAARMAGWLAHAMEQASTGRLIRPRARYVGPALDRS
ncbi:citrate synthase [Mesorhizobium sp. L-8-3]|uniref:citrate synthase n=1 Tax=Mesorhizobium sp. L-8-3 TaxID=2744522 RepID=UPI001925691A|nr:citrate synthase [Mesorhizobium sp. L-8-3]BCH24695.1 citrate synthase [Mesorhizobium sp. L-8-3]